MLGVPSPLPLSPGRGVIFSLKGLRPFKLLPCLLTPLEEVITSLLCFLSTFSSFNGPIEVNYFPAKHLFNCFAG